MIFQRRTIDLTNFSRAFSNPGYRMRDLVRSMETQVNPRRTTQVLLVDHHLVDKISTDRVIDRW